MHIVIACPYPPFEGIPTAGGGFLHAYISHLAKSHDVDLICTTEPEPRTAATYDGSVGVHFSPPRRSGGTSRLRQQARTLTGFNIGAPEVDGLTGDARARQLLKAADIVDFQWSELLRALPTVRSDRGSRPIVATEHDVYARGMVRRARFQSDTLGRLPWRRRTFVHAAIFTEAFFLRNCDLVQVFNRDDIAFLRRGGLRRPCVVLDPLIEQSSEGLLSENSKRLIFASAFTRGANVEGARWFIREVWPSVVQSVPDATLVLAGDGSTGVLAECPAPGASATGYVADLKMTYSGCAIAIAPLLLGAGLKFKVPQALAYGFPVVTTSIGAEGMPAGCPAVITDTPKEMAAAIVGLLRSPTRARELGEAGRSWVAHAFDFSRSMDQVERRFEDLLRKAEG
jgi:glycosyltransferase involved in cell wall biosynthesis